MSRPVSQDDQKRDASNSTKEQADCPPLNILLSSSTEKPTRRIRWSHSLAQNIPQILLTLAGLSMGACAIALLIEEQRTPGTQLHESITAVVLLIIWFAAQSAYIVIFCIRISTIPTSSTSAAALPPAAHYVLRTLTGVLIFIMLPITLAHLSKSGPVAEDFAVYLPFVMSLSAFINSLVGNPTQYLAPYASRGHYGMDATSFPSYGTMGHSCCYMTHGSAYKPSLTSRMVDNCVDGAANGIVGSVV